MQYECRHDGVIESTMRVSNFNWPYFVKRLCDESIRILYYSADSLFLHRYMVFLLGDKKIKGP